MKKIITGAILVFMMLNIFAAPPTCVVSAADIPQTVKVVSNKTCIYALPSITSNILKSDCMYGTELKVKKWDSTAENFYEVYIYNVVDGASEADVGYVLLSHVLDTKITSPAKKLDDNAIIKESAVVFQKTETSYVETGITLAKDTKVRVLDGYDSSRKYTYISFMHEDNIVSYYVLTSTLFVPGINYTTVIAVMTLITGITILSLVLGLKNKRKNKKHN